jgi:hypothetical protein
MIDLSLDPACRPSEQERALMLSLLSGLVEQIAEELLIRLPGGTGRIEIDAVVGRLHRSGLLTGPALVGLLVRRADLIAFRAAARHQDGASLVKEWTNDADGSLASAAMAVVIARASHRDRFGGPGFSLADCDAETAVSLTYAVAAALPGIPETLVAAAVDLLARHDEGERLDAQEARLMLALDRLGRIDGPMLLSLLAQGEVGLLAEGLSRLAGLPADEAWNMLTSRNGGEVGRLLRLGELGRPFAAALIAALSETRALIDPTDAIAAFDAMTPDEVSAERARMRLPAAFISALAALEGHGQRGA